MSVIEVVNAASTAVLAGFGGVQIWIERARDRRERQMAMVEAERNREVAYVRACAIAYSVRRQIEAWLPRDRERFTATPILENLMDLRATEERIERLTELLPLVAESQRAAIAEVFVRFTAALTTLAAWEQSSQEPEFDQYMTDMHHALKMVKAAIDTGLSNPSLAEATVVTMRETPSLGSLRPRPQK